MMTDDSVQSSALVSHLSLKAPLTFPMSGARHRVMADPVKKKLKEMLALSDTFIQGLERGGYVTPATIVINFGDEAKYLALSFGRIGSELFQTPHAKTLVIFCRLQLGLECGDIEISNRRLRQVQKKPSYNADFLNMTEEEFASIAQEFSTD